MSVKRVSSSVISDKKRHWEVCQKSVIECHLRLKEALGSVSKECHRVSSQIKGGTGKCVKRVSSGVISD